MSKIKLLSALSNLLPNNKDAPRGQWILSLEAGSALIEQRIGNIYLDELSFYSKGILNFGYRWNIGKK